MCKYSTYGPIEGNDLISLTSLKDDELTHEINNLNSRQVIDNLPIPAYLFALDNAFTAGFCVYAHEVDRQVVYIGMGTLARAFAALPRDRTDIWRAAVGGRSVRVGIISWHTSRPDAVRAEAVAIQQWRPAANMNSTGERRRVGTNRAGGRQVVCVETGRVFPSCTAAGKWLGATQGAITNVARGRYPAVKGYRFRYLDPEAA